MITLKKVIIHKFKSIESDQTFEVEPDVTVLVGMNESGKTSILEALAKSNYFEKDDKFKYNATYDYPRREKKRMDKDGIVKSAITCSFGLDSTLITEINNEIGAGMFTNTELSISYDYDNKPKFINLNVNSDWLIKSIATTASDVDSQLENVIKSFKNDNDFQNFIKRTGYEDRIPLMIPFQKYFKNVWKWENPIEEYVARVLVDPKLPKFLYYDEYYSLPSRISIEKLQSNNLESEELKTAKALFDLAEINIEELLKANDFENYKAELEATEATISEELFEYWSANKNIDIVFDIDKKEQFNGSNNTRIVEHILDIRVKNNRTKVSLPLKNRSKGFNWFFSFLVWFKKIQEDINSKYIILLDEPGLNLHASAQSDLLNFLDHLSSKYQVIYTTHSPFMIRPSELHRVRTVFETEEGSIVSESIQEKDPNTLFPLQAALGYDIAQNLYISKNNLLVEGTSDLIYLESISGILEAAGREPLRDDITIVPVGGLEKVSTFISLLRGNKLDVVCLLDSALDQSSVAKLDRLIAEKIIKKQKIRFYHEFITGSKSADVEDLFQKGDYLKFFNGAFTEHSDISESNLDPIVERIVEQIAKVLSKPRFNHYRPANYFARQGLVASDLSNETLDRFELAIKSVNESFGETSIKETK